MSASEVPLQASPLLGEHTNEVLSHDLNLGTGELGKLSEEGIIEG